MKIAHIAQILNAKVYCGEDCLEQEVHNACGCDMMSDALAFIKDQAVLLTGLVNPQVIRTAEMMDVACVVFVRGKEPTQAMVDMARQRSLVLLSTSINMFPACGMLYNAGLDGGGQF
jgi:predicted transcriptional regulator